MAGVFITVEGIEGVGKTTNMAFIRDFLQSRGVDLTVTREPGGTPLAEKIRGLLLNHSDEVLNENAELLLVFAARAQHLNQLIKPALVGREAIYAALHPKAGKSLYFVARGDGGHFFSDTLEQHNKAVRRYQINQRAEQYRSSPKTN